MDEPLSTSFFNPATGETIGTSALHNEEDVKRAVARARVAQPRWAARPPRERARVVYRMQAFLDRKADRIAGMIAANNGKTRCDAMATEVFPAAIALKYYCRKAPNFLKTTSAGFGSLVMIHKRTQIVRVPYGVVGIISPWNYPFSIPFSEVVMALLAGNAVILKTATQTQGVGLLLKACVESAELPPGLFHYVNLPGRIAGDALLSSGVDKLFFTGSVPVGKYLMERAAATLTPVNLELGGNDAMLVCPDADLVRAAAGACWAGFSNAGQSCGGVERVYVHRDVYDAFLEELSRQTRALRVWPDEDFQSDVGVMTTEAQCQVVQAHIDDALSKGARIVARATVTGGKSVRNVMNPVVLADVTHEMKVMREETFGPVLAVMPVPDMDTAVELANHSNLGLTGSVWTRNRRKGIRLARRIEAGAVTLNDHLMSHGLPETAWGGFKESGIGRSHGKLGFDEMTRPQMVVEDRLPFAKRQLWWYPYSEELYRGLRGLMIALVGRGWFRRLAGLGRAIKILPRMFKRP